MLNAERERTKILKNLVFIKVIENRLLKKKPKLGKVLAFFRDDKKDMPKNQKREFIVNLYSLEGNV